MLRKLSTRTRFVLAAAIATLPLLALVAYSAADRYNADRARAETRAINRAELFATLLSEENAGRAPSPARLKKLLGLSVLPAGSAVAVFDVDGREASRAGPAAAGPPVDDPGVASALRRRRGNFGATGGDGVRRVWGLSPVGDGPLTVAFGLPGDAVYGSAQSALRRDLALAGAAALAALAAAFLLAGRVTAPIRRLAAHVGGGAAGANHIGTIERGFHELGETIEESRAQLAHRAERLAALRAIDKAILAAETPAEIAHAALVRLRRLVAAARASVVLFDRDQKRSTVLAVDSARGTRVGAGAAFPLADELFQLDALESGHPVVRAELSDVDSQSEVVSLLVAEGIRSHASIPLVAEGELLGALNLGFSQPAAAGSEEALTVGAEVADQLAILLRQARLRSELQAVVDAALEGIVVLDSERRFVSVNDAAARLYGGKTDDALGRPIEDVVVLDAELLEQTWRHFLETGTLEGVFPIEFRDGARRQVEIRGRAEFLPGRHLFAVHDVTERRRLEEQLRQGQKMEAIGQLAGGVAHDFNNLLTAISGYGLMARRRIGAGPGATELVELERAAERAAQLTRQLLAFSRQQVLEPVVLDLNEVVSALMPMLSRLIGEDVEIAVLAGDVPPVLADRGQIEQVLVNLAVNARDAMPEGGTLTIETEAAVLDERYAPEHAGVEAGDHVCLTVTDTGLGMAPDEQERVFEPFYTTKDVGHGTGLGLATVHGIVSQSRGHVLVYSEPGLGTSFKVYLPAAESTAAMRFSAAPHAPDRLAGDETVLLCEDDELVRNLIVAILTDHGYRVLTATRPLEAIELAAASEGEIDVLVTDVVMPQMSGPELYERLVGVRPGLPALFLSGYTAETVRRRGNLPPGSAFLAKPFDDVSLLQTIRGLLDRRSAPSGSEGRADERPRNL